MLGHDVMVRPLRTPASTRVQGPWQMTATGLLASNIPWINLIAALSMRSSSGFATPPGSTSPSKSVGLASLVAMSTANVSALSRWLNA